jgi:hypothetical protein
LFWTFLLGPVVTKTGSVGLKERAYIPLIGSLLITFLEPFYFLTKWVPEVVNGLEHFKRLDY